MACIRSRLVRACASAAAGFALLPVAAPAQEAGSQLALSLRLATRGHASKFLSQLQYNCNLFFSVGQVPQGGSRGTYASFSRPALGTVDFAAGSGEVRAQRGEWQVEALPPSNARPTRFAELGIALRGRRVFVTARVTTGPSFISGARRVRLAEVLGAKLEHGPLIDRRNRQVPNTFSTTITGRLSMLAGMSRALERTRCKDRRRNRLSRRLRPGYVLGRFLAELRPGRATGLAGTAELRVTGLAPDARPGAGSALNAAGAITAPIAAGFPVPLVCVRGDQCVPSGGTFSLGGWLELVNGDRVVAVGDLVIATTGSPPEAPRQTITGTLGGAAVTVAEGPASGPGGTPPLAMTADFNQRAGAALGTELAGFLTVEPAFTRTWP